MWNLPDNITSVLLKKLLRMVNQRKPFNTERTWNRPFGWRAWIWVSFRAYRFRVSDKVVEVAAVVAEVRVKERVKVNLLKIAVVQDRGLPLMARDLEKVEI